MPASLWSGNLRLSLVLIPVRIMPAILTTEAISFRQIHEPSGEPIRYVKGIREGEDFIEVPEDEIVKGYEHAKGQHVLIRPEEIDDLKLPAKSTIDLERFVDQAEIDSRFWEKPYYLVPDGNEADEGYTVMRQALEETGKVAIGQLIMGGRGHLVGIKPHGRGLMLSILRYAGEVRDADRYFDSVTAEPDAEAVALAVQLIEAQTGPFKPTNMPNQFAESVRALVRAKVEQRAPEIAVAKEGKEAPAVINIMAALKQSFQAKGRAKLHEAVSKRSGKTPTRQDAPRSPRPRPSSRRTAH